jgi:hypothetical protein
MPLPGERIEAGPASSTSAARPPGLPDGMPSCMRSAMQTRPRSSNSSSGFAGEALRALSSALLLLGLIGDRRAR